MYNENQLIKIKWNNTNKDWYKSKGYVFTKRYDEFLVKAKDLSPHSSAKIKVICDYCGAEYETQYASIINGRRVILKDCCSHCTGLKTSEVSLVKRANKYIGLAKKICEEYGYKLLTTVGDYTDVKMDIEFVCPIHGKQVMMLDNLIRGHKCYYCSYEERGKKLRHSIDYIESEINSINGNKLLNPQDYKDSVTRNLKIRCSCGNIFTTSFSNYTKHGINTCFSCSCKESTGEERIRNFLELNKIDFVQEKRFPDCRDKKPLPFDFYLPKYNLILEFDGQQHYEPKFGKKSYLKTVEHDKIKDEYCKSHGIYLLRIPYWDGNNIEEIITNELKDKFIGKRYSLVS